MDDGKHNMAGEWQGSGRGVAGEWAEAGSGRGFAEAGEGPTPKTNICQMVKKNPLEPNFTSRASTDGKWNSQIGAAQRSAAQRSEANRSAQRTRSAAQRSGIAAQRNRSAGWKNTNSNVARNKEKG